MVRWVCSIRPEDKIYLDKLRDRRKYLQHRRLKWFGQIEKMEESAW